MKFFVVFRIIVLSYFCVEKPCNQNTHHHDVHLHVGCCVFHNDE